MIIIIDRKKTNFYELDQFDKCWLYACVLWMCDFSYFMRFWIIECEIEMHAHAMWITLRAVTHDTDTKKSWNSKHEGGQPSLKRSNCTNHSTTTVKRNRSDWSTKMKCDCGLFWSILIYSDLILLICSHTSKFDFVQFMKM